MSACKITSMKCLFDFFYQEVLLSNSHIGTIGSKLDFGIGEANL